MKTRILLLCSCVLLLVGCDGFRHTQYVIRNASFEEKETILTVLEDVANTSMLGTTTNIPYTSNYLAHYFVKPEEGRSVTIWVDARVYDTDVVIDLCQFPYFLTLPPAHKSLKAMLSQDLLKTFGERMTIDPRPKVPFPKNTKVTD